MGTFIRDLPVSRVADADTLAVKFPDGSEEKLRLIAIDTEESHKGGNKPVTNAGLLASKMAKDYFGETSGSFANVDIEFDTDDPVEVCLKRHRGNYGRLLCYVHKNGENYNLKLVREGWSPYFMKYGRSREYHVEMTVAEAQAQADNRVIWDPVTNAAGPQRDYLMLIPWWEQRALLVEDYRQQGIAKGVLSVRLDYEKIVEAASQKLEITVFCDLQNGIEKGVGGDNARINAGSSHHRLNLWIPDLFASEAQRIINLLEKRYLGEGRRNYVYVRGVASLFGSADAAKPQIVLSQIDQLQDFPG